MRQSLYSSLATALRGSQISDWRLEFDRLAHFFERQLVFFETVLKHKFTLYGGARGPGKSYALRWTAVGLLLKWASEGHHGVRVMVACEDYPSLYDRQISKVLIEFPASLGRWNGQLKEFRLHRRYGGGVIAFRNLDDPHKYQSAEFAAILIDEITRAISARAFNVLRGSLRWPGIRDVRFAGATNPNGPFARWVRAVWIERSFEDDELKPLAALAGEFVFVPGRPYDNPHLAAEYWDMLLTLPTDLKRAWLEGDWYVPAVGLVYADFGQDNLLDWSWQPLLAVDDESGEALVDQDGLLIPVAPFELAFDDGFVDPRAMYLIQRTGSHIYVFWEFWHLRKLAAESLDDLAALCEANRWPLPEIAVGSSEAVEFREEARRRNIPARGGTHEIVEGIKKKRKLIRDGQGYRTLQIHPRCTHLIGEMTEGYRYFDEEETRDRNTEKPLDRNNHGCDALRYWCWLRS